MNNKNELHAMGQVLAEHALNNWTDNNPGEDMAAEYLIKEGHNVIGQGVGYLIIDPMDQSFKSLK